MSRKVKGTSSVKAFGVNIPVRKSKSKSGGSNAVKDKHSEVCIPPTLIYKSKNGELVKS